MRQVVLRSPLSLGALALALVLGALGCKPAAPPEIRIGLVGVFTGSMAGASGIPAQLAARLAVAEINAAGGVLVDGKPHLLRLIEAQTENRPDAAAVTARHLINIDSVDVLIGPQSSALAVAAAPIAEESEVLMIAPMASNPLVTAGRRFVFRLAFLDSFQGEVLARFAFDSLGIRRAAAMHDAASPYGRDIAALFAKTFSDLGGTVVGIETFDSDDARDYRPQLRRLLAGRPQALLIPNLVTGDSLQLRQALELGFRGRFLGADSWDVRGLAPFPAYHGALIVGNWDRDTTRAVAKQFRANWERAYEEAPVSTAPATYDAVYIISESFRRAGTKRIADVADSLRNFGAWDGALTAFRFSGSNDPVRGAVILELDGAGLGMRTSVPPPKQ